MAITGKFPNGIDTMDATAVASSMLSGKTAYAKGVKVTGTIPSKTAATITPRTTNQTIASGQYLSGTQTITGDADLISANIKAGKNIFGVAGKASVVDTTDATAIASDVRAGKTAYKNGSRLTGTMKPFELGNVDGITWTQSNMFANSWYAPVELSTGRLIVGNKTGGICYSDNKGKTWTSSVLQTSSQSGSFYTPIELRTGRLVAGSNGNGIWYSNDKGLTWISSKSASGSFFPIELSTGRLVAGSYDLDLQCDNVVWYSDDNGITWLQSDSRFYLYTPVELRSGRLVAGSNGYGIWYSDNKGKTWTYGSTTTGSFYTPLELSTGRLVVGECSGGGILYSDDSGLNWAQSGLGSDYYHTPIELSTGRLISCCSGGRYDAGIYYSDNNGATWTHSGTNGYFYKALELSTGRLVVGSTYSGAVLYSDNQGATWTATSCITSAFLPVELSTGRIVAGSSNGIWCSDLANVSPTELTVTPEAVLAGYKACDQNGKLFNGTLDAENLTFIPVYVKNDTNYIVTVTYNTTKSATVYYNNFQTIWGVNLMLGIQINEPLVMKMSYDKQNKWMVISLKENI